MDANQAQLDWLRGITQDHEALLRESRAIYARSFASFPFFPTGAILISVNVLAPLTDYTGELEAMWFLFGAWIAFVLSAAYSLHSFFRLADISRRYAEAVYDLAAGKDASYEKQAVATTATVHALKYHWLVCWLLFAAGVFALFWFIVVNLSRSLAVPGA